jgi:ABC-type phosphate transport system substrate-binding protein
MSAMKQVLTAAATMLVAAAALLHADELTVRVVVNVANPVSSMEKAELAQLFLKKATKWSSGQTVQPVDLAEGSKTRERFAKEILGKTASALSAYWLQQIFAGKEVPPLSKSSEAETVAFVRSNPNAIAYVSAETDITGVKVLVIK